MRMQIYAEKLLYLNFAKTKLNEMMKQSKKILFCCELPAKFRTKCPDISHFMDICCRKIGFQHIVLMGVGCRDPSNMSPSCVVLASELWCHLDRDLNENEN